MAAAHALRAVPAEVLVEAAVSLPTICVIGLGYVGVVSVGCLAERGFKVIGADLDAAKVACVAEGRSPIVERGLEALLSDGVRLDRVSATRDVVPPRGPQLQPPRRPRETRLNDRDEKKRGRPTKFGVR